MGLIPHAITFVFVAAITVAAFINLSMIHRAHKAPILRQLLAFMCLFQILTMASFTANQISWIVNDHESFVGLDAQLGWLAYDYQNKLFHLTAALALNYYLRFKHVDPKEANRGRRTDD